jgi:hypothetical protein
MRNVPAEECRITPSEVRWIAGLWESNDNAGIALTEATPNRRKSIRKNENIKCRTWFPNPGVSGYTMTAHGLSGGKG